ncbi:MAG: DUF6048 family protein [Cyclobacteriaceae bacterium]|nr:DUF6048 family protein [Cyclobacteriaceae bacterium]
MTALRLVYYSKRFIFLAALTFCSVLARGQELAVEDSVQIPPTTVTIAPTDSAYQKKFVSGVELKVDYGKLLMAWTKFETKLEAGINVRFFERMVLVTEFGSMELNPLKAYDNAVYYSVTGQYARAGLDYYTSYNPTSFYFGGLRYGMSQFSDEGEFLIESDYFEDYSEGFGSDNIQASWMEIVIGTETFLNVGKKKKENAKNRLLLGWNGSLRFLTDFTNREQIPIYSIPGYGRTFNKVTPALNFYVKFRLGR